MDVQLAQRSARFATDGGPCINRTCGVVPGGAGPVATRLLCAPRTCVVLPPLLQPYVRYRGGRSHVLNALILVARTGASYHRFTNIVLQYAHNTNKNRLCTTADPPGHIQREGCQQLASSGRETGGICSIWSMSWRIRDQPAMDHAGLCSAAPCKLTAPHMLSLHTIADGHRLQSSVCKPDDSCAHEAADSGWEQRQAYTAAS